MTRTIIFAFLACFSLPAFAAVQGKADDTTLALTISGSVADADAAQLEALLAAHPPGRFAKRLLTLDSEGGDPEAAMKLGRLLRAHKFSAEVPAGRKCTGACVFVLAAAEEKQVAGTVGIVRPAAVRGSGAEAMQFAADTPNRYRKYFAEVGTPVDLGELMLNTPAGKTRILNEHELVFFRLNTQTELQYDEDNNAAMAKKMGLTLPQYLQFKELLVYKCDMFKDDPAERAKCLDKAYRNFLPAPGK